MLRVVDNFFKKIAASVGRPSMTDMTDDSSCHLVEVFVLVWKENNERKISIEIDEMQCKALMFSIQSREEFVGQVEFGEVEVQYPAQKSEHLFNFFKPPIGGDTVDGDIDEVYEEGETISEMEGNRKDTHITHILFKM
ncbi:Uncharacterized protein APZ42_031335 [Daphnia magna]|uniref:Uncharacterized protein n=1 Tax=Daphnia magna TaxID=35525 RepID=A0A164MXR7_9CRUS|nr:Uncharacterized protein APZ42_031335 [Daphnia magna]